MGTTFLVTACILGAPGLKEKPNPTDGLIGLWELVRSESGRPQRPQKRHGPVRYRFNNNGTFVVLEGDKEVVGPRAFKFDSKSDLATLELKIDKGPFVVMGIYKIEGDKLTICTGFPGKARPTKFEVPTGSSDNLAVYRRVKKD